MNLADQIKFKIGDGFQFQKYTYDCLTKWL